ncbi:Alpha N-terminal protein methyltransferase 1, partial [Tetrabaena socialis]
EGFVVDSDDSSLTRCNTYMLDLFQKAGAKVLYNLKQRNWPKDLFEVRMYVLQPARPGAEQAEQAGAQAQ